MIALKSIETVLFLSVSTGRGIQRDAIGLRTTRPTCSTTT